MTDILVDQKYRSEVTVKKSLSEYLEGKVAVRVTKVENGYVHFRYAEFVSEGSCFTGKDCSPVDEFKAKFPILLSDEEYDKFFEENP